MTTASQVHAEEPEQTEHEKRVALHRAARASFIGNFIEWFDYASYGYLAIVIGAVFFPQSDELVRTMLTFAVFAMSFILRPVGAVLWGTWGDRWGRRWALSWSILIMAGSTFLIGCLPGHRTIGVAAPILLLILRMAQGFSASGEYAGAATFLAEYAPPKQRGIFTSLVPASTATGLLMGSLMVSGLNTALSDAAMESWGWRIPFLLAGPLGLIGRYIRVHLEDTPAYSQMMENLPTKKVEKTKWSAPLKDLLKHHQRATIITFGVACLNAVAFYLLLSYMPTYIHEVVGMEKTQATLATSITLAVYILAIFGMGHLSDYFGRRTMLIVACVAFIILTVPLFKVMTTSGFLGVVLCEIAFALILTANDGTLPTFLAESFPTNVRYSGFALSFNGANALLGGTAPFIATWLIRVTGNSLAPAYYLTGIAILAMIAILFSRNIRHGSLTADDPKPAQ
ncbi:MFS transporter [Actinomyces vulturis]|uniref:MFS transporter n=1 Tax=Actinomyces vulturis TaxID=1857645 RepID=UPI000829E28D|nr:MFS transporter [Actinomyces vulturis]